LGADRERRHNQERQERAGNADKCNLRGGNETKAVAQAPGRGRIEERGKILYLIELKRTMDIGAGYAEQAVPVPVPRALIKRTFSMIA
jgi:hypothetical protein